MAGYVGTELQISRARQSDAHSEWTRTTRGACNNGRMLACDDVDAIGWPTILDVMARDGAFGFRLMPVATGRHVADEMIRHGYRLDLWDTFIASRATAMERARAILAAGLPAGLSRLDLGRDPEAAPVRQVQEFMLTNGIVPFSGSMLVGALVPGRAVAIADEQGEIAATAFTYMPHNAMSPHRDKAWGGLVAVSPTQRGRKLGLYVNAAIVEAAFEELGAVAIYEMVSETNVASRRMVESCGLVHDQTIASGAAVADAQRYTT